MPTAKLKRNLRRIRRLNLEVLEDRRVLASGIGTFDPSVNTFALRNNATAGQPDAGSFRFSASGDRAVVGDWNGDGRDDFGIFNTSSATWSLKYGAEGGSANAGVFQFGDRNAIPVVGDWNGDGRDDLGTYKNGTWRLRSGASPGPANAGVFNFGGPASQPVVGDWNGDGRDGIGLFGEADSRWTLRQIASGGATNLPTFTFGPNDGIAVVGDWDGDGTDGIGVYQPDDARWTLRQLANAGTADAGVFVFGQANLLPVAGDFAGPPAPADALATIILPAIDLDLLGLEVRTSPISVFVSTNEGDGKLLGNLLGTVSSLIDLNAASGALNTVLDSTVDLLNSASLQIDTGVGSLDDAPAGTTQVLELFVAPVHLDLLGVQVDTSTVRVTITARSGQDLVLGNAVTELLNLFNPPLPEEIDIDFLNSRLAQLLDRLDAQLPGIASAPVPPVPISDGQILNITVPPLDVDLLGLVLQTSPITVNASAESGDGALLGNVLTTALRTLDATPQNLSELNTHINDVLAKVIGVLNAADLTLLAGTVDALPPVLQTLLSSTLTAPAEGSTAPILDLLIASSDGTSPPIDVDLLGLVITTSNIEAHLSARTGEDQILGNLLYNLANLADAGGPAGILNLVNLLGTGALDDPGEIVEGAVTPPPTPTEELLTLTVNPLNIDLLGLEIRTDPIIVTLSTQGGDGKLLGNLLNGITTLINVDSVSNALNNVLSTTIDLLNSASLIVDGVGSGSFDDAPVAVTPVLDVFVAPVYLDLLGLVAETAPIHLTIIARSGPGRVLGNVVRELANVFNPPLPDRLDIDFVNDRLAALIQRLNDQIPLIPSAPIPPVSLENGEFLELTVPAIDLDLLGLVLQTSPITVNAAAETGDGLLLGNVLTTVLNTVDATTENLTGLNTNLNALLAKVVGVLNASSLVLSSTALDPLLEVLQTVASPTLIAPESGASTQILDLVISSGTNSGPPVDVDLLGLSISTSNIDAQLLAETGDGKVLGNLLYNVANLLNPRGSTILLSLLTQLGQLPLPNAPRLKLSGLLNYAEQRLPVILSADAIVTDRDSRNFATGKLTVAVAENATAGDRLRIRNQGTATGQIGVDGARISFGGTTIGTFAGGLGGVPLVVTLNANATRFAVQSLVRNITYSTLGDVPSTLTRTITFKLTDQEGGLSNLAAVTVNVVAVNDRPVIVGVGAAVTYRENGPPLPITAAIATVTDPDSPDFAGGTLVARISSGARAEDRLLIRLTAALTLNGDRVLLNGQVIGTFTGGGTAPLVVTFNANASPGRVNVVLRSIAYQNVSHNPASHARTVWLRVQDGDGGTSVPVTKIVNVVAVNDAPELGGIGGTIGYQRNTSAIVLASTATVTDVDSRNFSGGKLIVQITGGGEASNRLLISGSLFQVEGNLVKRNGVTIGTLNANGGVGTTRLEVTFNSQALPGYVQQLVRSLRFRTVGTASTIDRTVTFSLTDGDGGTSDTLTRTVNVG